MTMLPSGGCGCGAIRYRFLAEPLRIHVCHCRSCQWQTGSAFAINLLIESDRLELLAGDPRQRELPRDDGSTQRVYACEVCQTTLFSTYTRPGILFVRAGTLDDPRSIQPDIHIWTRSKVAWLTLPPGVPALEVDYDWQTVWPQSSVDRLRAALDGDVEF